MHEQSMAAEEKGEAVKAGTEMRDVTFDLTQQEFAEKAKEAAFLMTESDRLNIEFQGVKDQYKAKISLKDQELSHVLAIVQSGKESREVECEMRFDYDRGVVEYWFDGKLRDERTMDVEERQGRMAL